MLVINKLNILVETRRGHEPRTTQSDNSRLDTIEKCLLLPIRISTLSKILFLVAMGRGKGLL